MTVISTTQPQVYQEGACLYMAFELSASKWRIAASDGGTRVSEKSLEPGDAERLVASVERMKTRFGVPREAVVRSCYEAGRDGFWVHRFLAGLGIENVVIDPASLKVDRHARRAKSDRLDARQMLAELVRYHSGEPRAFRVARVPSVEEEDNRRLHRNLERLKQEQTRHRVRIRSLLATQGVRPKSLDRVLEDLDAVRIWDGSALPPELKAELEREGERLALVRQQIRRIHELQAERVKAAKTAVDRKIRRLTRLGAIGLDSAWLLTMEVFGWRTFQNRRQVGGMAGLGGTPHSSGQSRREQGISKAGNARVRTRMVELAWLWLRYQPQSQLAQWYQRRFAKGGPRLRRVGIVALARRLLIELWQFAEHGVVPAGARIELTD